jgi:hypothetical protein
MKLFLDFDGVVNFSASRSAYTKNRDTLGYARRTALLSGGSLYNVQYSAELVKKLNDAHEEHKFNWLWLTTWHKDAVAVVDKHLGTESDGFVDWSPHAGVRLGQTEAQVVAVRAANKLSVLKENYGGEPFIWVDDDATDNFNPTDFPVPHLVVKPDERYGITRTDWDKMTEFMRTHS